MCISFPHSSLENRNSLGSVWCWKSSELSPENRVGCKQLAKKTSELVTDAAEIKQLALLWITANLTTPSYRHRAPPEKQTDKALDSMYLQLWRRQIWEYLVNPVPKILLGRAAWPSSTSTENLLWKTDFRPDLQANHHCFCFKRKPNSFASCFWSSSPQQEQGFCPEAFWHEKLSHVAKSLGVWLKTPLSMIWTYFLLFNYHVSFDLDFVLKTAEYNVHVTKSLF